MISFQWQGLKISVNAGGDLHLQGNCAASPDVLEALGDVMLGMSRLLSVENTDERVVAAPRTAAVALQQTPTAPASRPHENPALSAAPANAAFTKPGPRQTAAWLSGERFGAPAAAATTAATPATAGATSRVAVRSSSKTPANPIEAVRGLVKPGPKRTAAFLNGGAAAVEPLNLNVGLMTPVAVHYDKPGPSATKQFLQTQGEADVAPNEASTPVVTADAPVIVVASAAIARRTPQGQLLREIKRWLLEHGKPATLAEIVTAAEEGEWSLATKVEPAILSTMRKNAKVFLRNPDGSFALRNARAPAKVVRRRAARHHDDV